MLEELLIGFTWQGSGPPPTKGVKGTEPRTRSRGQGAEDKEATNTERTGRRDSTERARKKKKRQNEKIGLLRSCF